MDCGGKQSDTPLFEAGCHAKAVSPLPYATAVQDPMAPAKTDPTLQRVNISTL
jgi:hypothetical protein